MDHGTARHDRRIDCLCLVSIRDTAGVGRERACGAWFACRIPDLRGGSHDFLPPRSDRRHQMTGASYLVAAWAIGLLLGFIRSLVQRR